MVIKLQASLFYNVKSNTDSQNSVSDKDKENENGSDGLTKETSGTALTDNVLASNIVCILSVVLKIV